MLCTFENVISCDPPRDEHGNISKNIIDDPNVTVTIHESVSEEALLAILLWFGPTVKIDMTRRTIHGDELYLKQPVLDHLKTFVNAGINAHQLMGSIAHIPKLSLMCTNCPAISFEHVDVTKNESLYVFVYDIDIRIHDFYKVTTLDFRKQFINSYDKLHASILESKEQARRYPFRLTTVCINEGICQEMLECLKLLPETCRYSITPHAASVLWDIAQLMQLFKEQPVKYYYCFTRAEYLRALLLQKSHPQCNLPISSACHYKPSEADVFRTVHDIHNAMSDADKKEWYGVYMLAAQCSGV